MSGKKTSWSTKAAKSFDICGCKIQNLKVGSVPTPLSCWFNKSLSWNLQKYDHSGILWA